MPDKTTPKFELLVDGSSMGAEVTKRLIAISVRQDLKMSDAIEVRMSNDDLAFTETDTFAEGKKLSIKLGYMDTDLVLVGTGVIARRDCEFPERGPSIVSVVAYDSEFKLKQGTKTRTFLDVKDSDVVSQLVSDAGLTADVDATTVTYPYLFQVAQTDLAFIRERAFRLGYVVMVDRENAKLSFKKPATSDAALVKLTWGLDLLHFRPRFSTSDQVSKVKVQGWDMKSKSSVNGEAQKSDLHSDMSGKVTGASRAESIYGERTVQYTPGVTTADEANQIAKAYLNQLLHTYAEGQGSCQGANKIAPGVVVEIAGVG